MVEFAVAADGACHAEYAQGLVLAPLAQDDECNAVGGRCRQRELAPQCRGVADFSWIVTHRIAQPLPDATFLVAVDAIVDQTFVDVAQPVVD